MTLVLAFDCAVSGLSAALVRDETCLARTSSPGRDQPARLMPAIAELIGEAKVARKDIGLIAVTVGPGSFTGVRVGLAAARGLGLGLGVPVAGLTTTAVLLAQDPADMAVIDTRLGDWYCETRDGKGPFLLDAASLAARRKDGATVVDTLPDPAVLARLALEKGVEHWRAEGMPRPLYLRGVNITTPDGTRRTVE